MEYLTANINSGAHKVLVLCTIYKSRHTSCQYKNAVLPYYGTYKENGKPKI